MNENALRPVSVVAAGLVIGGIVAFALPNHALSVLRVFIVFLGVVAGLHALELNVPPSGWLSPFKWLSPFGRRVQAKRRRRGQAEIDYIQSKLSERRQRLPYGPPMPPAILRFLRPLIRGALDLGSDDQAPPPSARTSLSPLSWAILTTEPLQDPFWFRTVSPDAREVAETVHAVLDELDGLTAGAGRPQTFKDTDMP